MEASGTADGILLRSINKAGQGWGARFSPKVIRRALSWSKSTFYWAMFRSKQQSDISDANGASITRSMIGSGSNRIRRDTRPIHLTCHGLYPNPPGQVINNSRDHAGAPDTAQ